MAWRWWVGGAALALLGLAAEGQARAPRPLQIGAETEALPLSAVGEDGQVVGFAPDLARAIGQRRGRTIVLVARPWAKLLEDLRAGKIDALAAAARSAEREQYLLFSSPHLVLRAAVFVRSGEKVARIADLKGRRVGVVPRGRHAELFAANGLERELVEVTDLRTALHRLARGEIDAVPATRMVAFKMLQEEGLTAVEPAEFDLALPDVALGFAVLKERPEALVALDEGLRELREDGTYQKAYERWIGPYEPRPLGWRDVRGYVLAVLAVLGAAGGAVLWQRRMLVCLQASATALRRSEERLGLVLEASGAAFWDWDLVAGTFVRSPRWAEMLHCTPELIGSRPSGLEPLVHEEDRSTYRAALERLESDQGEIAVEIRVAAGVAGWRWYSLCGRVIAREATGRPLRAAGTFTDVTRRRQAEEERQRFERQLFESQKLESLGLLAGGVAHDFNNLLMVILGNTGLARSELGGGPTDSLLGEVEDAARRAAELCRQMLAYAGRTTVERSTVNLTAVVQETRELLVASCGHRVRFDWRLPDPGPLVSGEATQLRQVLLNLVINAGEALPDGMGTIAVSTGLAVLDSKAIGALVPAPELPAGRYAFIEVADTGIGITPETLVRVFEPFYSTKFTGRGLGLAAAIGIARLHGGTIAVSNAEPRGAVFRLWVPALGEGPVDSAAASGERRPQLQGQGEVLVVDDEAIVRDTIAAVLRRAGYRPQGAGDGAQAVALVEAEPERFGAVVLDLTMPEMDGATAFRRLRVVRPDLPVLLVSGFSEEDMRREIDSAEHVAYLHKPFENEEMLVRLAALRAGEN